MKFFLIPFLLFAFILHSCKSIDKNVVIEQIQPEYPVLKFKDFNHVLQIKIVLVDSTKTSMLNEIDLNLNGTSDFSSIESVALYNNSSNKGFLTDQKVLFAESNEIKPTMRFKGKMNLKQKENILWVSFKLKDDTDISSKLACVCKSVITNYGTAKVKELINPTQLRMGVALRNHNDDDVHTYRIPGLVTTNKGTLLACYDVRRDLGRDLQGNMDIGISRSIDGGNTWEPMRIAIDMGEYGGLPQKFNGVSDACLLVDKNSDNIFVCGLWMHGVINDDGKWIDGLTEESEDWNHQWLNKGSQSGFGIKQTAQFLIAKSNDDGKSWQEPVNLTQMCKKEEWWLWAPAPGAGITMSNGTLVLPTQGRDKKGECFSNITYSSDGGKTWKTSSPAYTNTTECAVVELPSGGLMLNMRDNRNWDNKGETNGRAIFTTNDMGETWIEHPTSHGGLNEPTCMASLYKHDTLLFFSNPDSKHDRKNITIRTSFDYGETWPLTPRLLLDEGNSAGYSCLTNIGDDQLGIIYESSQAQLVFQRISINDILKN